VAARESNDGGKLIAAPQPTATGNERNRAQTACPVHIQAKVALAQQSSPAGGKPAQLSIKSRVFNALEKSLAVNYTELLRSIRIDARRPVLFAGKCPSYVSFSPRAS
jgi:hypothetical protein